MARAMHVKRAKNLNLFVSKEYTINSDPPINNTITPTIINWLIKSGMCLKTGLVLNPLTVESKSTILPYPDKTNNNKIKTTLNNFNI